MDNENDIEFLFLHSIFENLNKTYKSIVEYNHVIKYKVNKNNMSSLSNYKILQEIIRYSNIINNNIVNYDNVVYNISNKRKRI